MSGKQSKVGYLGLKLKILYRAEIEQVYFLFHCFCLLLFSHTSCNYSGFDSAEPVSPFFKIHVHIFYNSTAQHMYRIPTKGGEIQHLCEPLCWHSFICGR